MAKYIHNVLQELIGYKLIFILFMESPMKNSLLLSALFAATALVAACGGDEATTSAPPVVAAPPSAGTPATPPPPATTPPPPAVAVAIATFSNAGTIGAEMDTVKLATTEGGEIFKSAFSGNGLAAVTSSAVAAGKAAVAGTFGGGYSGIGLNVKLAALTATKDLTGKTTLEFANISSANNTLEIVIKGSVAPTTDSNQGCYPTANLASIPAAASATPLTMALNSTTFKIPDYCAGFKPADAPTDAQQLAAFNTVIGKVVQIQIQDRSTAVNPNFSIGTISVK
jgi:hypothetical protein